MRLLGGAYEVHVGSNQDAIPHIEGVDHKEEDHRQEQVADGSAEDEGECHDDGREGDPCFADVDRKHQQVENDEKDMDCKPEDCLQLPHNGLGILQRERQILALLQIIFHALHHLQTAQCVMTQVS